MKPQRIAVHMLLALGIVLGTSCSTKSPSEPGGGTPATPKPPIVLPGTSIVVTASPSQILVGSTNTASISVRATRADTGAPLPDGTVVTLTTTLGVFGSAAGTSTTTLQLVNGQGAAVLFPGTSVGTATITATVADSSAFRGGSASTQVRIGQSGAFFVSSVTPNVGNPQGGEQVIILGGGFVSPVRVTFNGTPAQVVSVSPGAIAVITPSASSAGVTVGVGQTASVPVGVTINLNTPNQASDTLNNGFTYSLGGQPQQPQVFSVNPASGPDAGGTPVTIIGQGFQSPVQVFFGSGTSASGFNGIEASIQSVTATQIVVLTPAASGFGQSLVDKLVDILVKNVNSGFSTVAPQSFKYGSGVLFTSLSPTITQWDKPIKVTVFGQGFQAPVAVDIGGIAAGVLQTSGTEIQVLTGIPHITSCSDLKAPSHVVNINTAQGATGPDFTYTVPKPVISGLSPNSGPQGGGNSVTISASGFDSSVGVVFGASAATVTSLGPSSITVTAPPFTGTFPTQACTVGTQTGTRSVPTSVDVILTNQSTTCSTTFKLGYTYNPDDTTCHVTPIPPPKASFTFTRSTGSFTVIFNDTSSGTVTSWLWDFGDATNSTSQNPVHTYPTTPTKTYTVTLTVTGPGGTSSSSQFVTVPGP